MSVTLSSTTTNTILDWVFNGSAASSGDRYLALDTDGSGTECTGGTYARADLDAKMGAASAGAISNDTSISFDIGSDVATHWRIMSASSGGTQYATGSLVTSKTGSFTLAVGEITCTCRGV